VLTSSFKNDEKKSIFEFENCHFSEKFMNEVNGVRRGAAGFLVSLFCLIAQSVVAKELSDSDKRQLIETMVADIDAEFAVPQVDVQTARSLLAQRSVLFVDVRDRDEIEVSSIPGSITRQEFERNPAQFRNQKLIAYCTIGYRSAKFTRNWNQQGFQISNLRGSLLLWAHANGSLVDIQGKPTHEIHVYGRKWNLLPIGYQSVY
jgi:rhodanese-related sulfurtransferase